MIPLSCRNPVEVSRALVGADGDARREIGQGPVKKEGAALAAPLCDFLALPYEILR